MKDFLFYTKTTVVFLMPYIVLCILILLFSINAEILVKRIESLTDDLFIDHMPVKALSIR